MAGRKLQLPPASASTWPSGTLPLNSCTSAPASAVPASVGRALPVVPPAVVKAGVVAAVLTAKPYTAEAVALPAAVAVTP